MRVKEFDKDFAVIAWDKPESDGGSPITGYLVEKKDASKKSFVKAGEVGESTYDLKLTKLVEGKEYDVQVYALNEVGSSEPQCLSKPVKARVPFGMFSNKFNSYVNESSTQFLV